MSGSDADLTGEVIDRRFRVERQLGSGGMGTVWLVQHVESLQRYALKVLNPGSEEEPAVVQRFLREARAAAALRTRHAVRIIDAQMGYVHAGSPTPFLVMELLEGDTLESVVERRGYLDTGEAVWALRQVARALTAAHEQGIVHRDLKPTNVFVATDEDGEPIVKLCDFGIVKLLPGPLRNALAETTKSTQARMLLGSPLYMAPEQLRDARTVVPTTDQWAFGLLAFYALSGQDFFGRCRDLTDLVMRIAGERLEAPSKRCEALPRSFDAWFFRSCAKESNERFRDVAQQMKKLEAALGHPAPVVLSPAGPVGESVMRARVRGASARPSTASMTAQQKLLMGAAFAASLVGLVGWHYLVGPWLEPALAHAVQRPEDKPDSASGFPVSKKASVAPPSPSAVPAAAPKAIARPVHPPSDNRPGETSKRRNTAPSSSPGPVRQSRDVTRPSPKRAPPSKRGAAQPAPTPPRRQAKDVAPQAVATKKASPSATSIEPSTKPAETEAEVRKASGQNCTRSAECQSGLCIAEVCR
jgi:serine/threonine-protein kinase